MSGFIFFWLCCGIAASYVAGQKNKGTGTWFLLGLLLGPIALIMVGLSPAAPAKEVGRHSFRPAKSTRVDKAVAFILAPFIVYAAAMILIPVEIMAKAHLLITICIFAVSWTLLWRPLMGNPKALAENFDQLHEPAPPQTRPCPFCAEDIKPAAIVCKHCGRDVPALPDP